MSGLRKLPTPVGTLPPLPPVANRGVSLLRWMMMELDEQIRRLFDKPEAEDPATPVAAGSTELQGSAAVWKWNWTPGPGSEPGRTGVTLTVEEESHGTVLVHVNDRLVIRNKPPWVRHHENGEYVDPALDARERREYNDLIIGEIKAALQ